MSLNDYRFRSVWTVRASADTVFDVLADLGNYPAWWSEVRTVQRAGHDCAELACRSLLPYTLVFRATHDRKDPAGGVLRARLTGDLEGYCGWVIRPDGAGHHVTGHTRMVWDQRVTVRGALLRAVAPVARPLLRFNHELMMRSGERGLRAYLAGEIASR